MEKRVQTVAAQATQAGEIQSGDCILPKEVNLTDLGTEAETISQHVSIATATAQKSSGTAHGGSL